MKKSNSDIQSKRPTECIAVFGGDRTWIKAVIRHWTGTPVGSLHKFERGFVRVDHSREPVCLSVVLDSDSSITAWPGGPLVWLLPERGPSQPELVQLRNVLSIHQTQMNELIILLCAPSDLAEENVANDLDVIVETLRWSLNPDQEFRIEAVWDKTEGENNLADWLSALRRDNGK